MDVSEVCWLVATFLSLLQTTSTEARGSTGCSGDDWRYDTDNQRCMTLSAVPMGLSQATFACWEKGGSLFTPNSIDDWNEVRKLFGKSSTPSELWGEYVIMRHTESFPVYDGHGYRVKTAECGLCASLVKQAAEWFRGVSDSRACVHLNVGDGTARWLVSGCDDQRHSICHYVTGVAEEPGLTTADIAAITVGSLIVLAFLVTVAIDCCIHKWKYRNSYTSRPTWCLRPDKTSRLCQDRIITATLAQALNSSPRLITYNYSAIINELGVFLGLVCMNQNDREEEARGYNTVY